MKRNLILIALAALTLGLFLAACGGGGGSASEPTPYVPAGDAVAGEAKFNEVCIACHGPAGVGVEGLGKPFTTSEFVPSKTDDELLAFVKTGRPISDPLNTTGVDMPPRGGNPALTDQQILDIIAYIRTLHQ